MRSSSSILIAAAAFAAAAVMGCQPNGGKNNPAYNQKEAAKENLDEAEKRYQIALDSFRSETNMRIQKNRDEIEAYRAKARENNTTLNQELVDEINELDRKNEALREKLANYKHKNDQDWKSFKDELNRDLDEVGTAFRNLGRKKNK